MAKVQVKPEAAKINGPLTVCSENPRYFAERDGRPVFLCGSHNWSNVQEIFSADAEAEFDYAAHLKWLQSYGHNYTRGWHWEATNWTGIAGAGELTNVRPLAYARTGPGTALDGLPRFDLTAYNQDHFDRLRRRVIMAGEHGIYFSVMLFEGFSVDTALLDQAAAHAVLLHCLPAHRGEEVSADAVDGARSRVWPQATNRMYSARAVFAWLVQRADR